MIIDLRYRVLDRRRRVLPPPPAVSPPFAAASAATLVVRAPPKPRRPARLPARGQSAPKTSPVDIRSPPVKAVMSPPVADAAIAAKRLPHRRLLRPPGPAGPTFPASPEREPVTPAAAAAASAASSTNLDGRPAAHDLQRGGRRRHGRGGGLRRGEPQDAPRPEMRVGFAKRRGKEEAEQTSVTVMRDSL